MIVPDVNLLLYAYNSSAREHASSAAWLEGVLNDSTTVGVAWITILGFLRISTSAKGMPRPLTVAQASTEVRGWLVRQNVTLLHPGDRHADILFGLLEHVGVGGNLTTDAHLAALAIENQAEVHSTDTDFARFPGLRWRNPIARASKPERGVNDDRESR